MVPGENYCYSLGLRGQPQYIALFVGYDASVVGRENMWLAEEKLSNATELLLEYRSRYSL